MALLRTLESELQALSQEARRSVPAVKEAAERALIDVRKLHAAAHADARGADAGKLSQLVHPFVLACNYTDAPKKVILQALSALQRVLAADALSVPDFSSLVRVLDIQGEAGDEDVRVKVLQMLPLTLAQRSAFPDAPALSTLLSRAFTFLTDRSVLIRNAASASLTQLVALVWERGEACVRSVLASGGPAATHTHTHTHTGSAGSTHAAGPAASGTASAIHVCALLAQDLLLVAGGMPPQWLRKSAPIPRVCACVMVDTLLREHGALMAGAPAMRALLHSVVAPLLLRQLPTQSSFPLALRFARITRSFLSLHHALAPSAACAVFYLLIRMLHACARGEDLGADTSTTLNRFGAAGAMILRGAHRALGAGGAAPLTHAAALAHVAPAPAAATAAPVSETPRDVAPLDDDVALHASVAALRLGPMPLWKSILLLETVHGVLAKPHVVCSLFRTMDMATGGSQNAGDRRKAVQQCTDALWMLIDRVVTSVQRAESGRSASFASEDAARERLTSPSAVPGSAAAATSSASAPPAGRGGRTTSTGESDDVVIEDEYALLPGDLDDAAQDFARRPLAHLTCPDEDSHITSSSVGGLHAASVAAGLSSNTSALSLVTGLFVGASVALVSNAVSTGSSLLSGGSHASKDGISSTSVTSPQPTDRSVSDTAAASPADAVLPPSNLFAGCIPLVALECIVHITAAVAAAAEAAAASAASTSSAPAEPLLRVGDLTHAHYAGGEVADGSSRAVRPLLYVPTPSADTSAAPARTPASEVLEDGVVDVTTAASWTAWDQLGTTGIARSSMGEVAAPLATATWQPAMSTLSCILVAASSPGLCAYVLKAYQAFTYACGALDLVEARDALLVNLCRCSLPNWQPTSVVNAVAASLLGAEHRMQRAAVTTRDDISAKHLLVLKTLFNIAHCLGGVLGMSWVVVIDTFEQFDRVTRTLEGGERSARRTVAPPPPGQAGLLGRLRQSAARAAGDSALLSLGVDSALDADAASAPGSQWASSVAQAVMGSPREELDDPFSAPVPDDELSVLTAALATLFEGTVYLPSAALKELVTALCDLSISALAESATAELADLAVDAQDDRADGATKLMGGKAASTQRSRLRRFGNARSRRAVRKAARQTTAVFGVEQVAADDAREIMAEEAGEGSDDSSGDDAEADADSKNVSVLEGATNTRGTSLPSPVTAPGGRGATSGMPSSRSAQPPFALTRMMETCAFNAWRLGAVWEPLCALLRVLARSPSASIRQYGLTALTELAIAHITGMTSPPRSSTRRARAGELVVPAATAESANAVIGQESLLAPLADYWRSPYADTRQAALQATLQLVEDAGASLSNPPSSPGAAAQISSAAKASPHADDTGGWSVVVGLLYAAACLGIGLAVTGEPLSTATQVASADPVSSAPAAAPLQRGPSLSSVQPTVSSMHANTLLASVPRCIFEIPDRHALAVYPQRARFMSAAFRVTELICDDFLDRLSHASLSFFLLVLHTTARYSEDMNAALSAVSQAWKISDAVAAWRGRTLASATSPSRMQPAEHASAAETNAAYGTLWSQVFVGVAQLCDGSTRMQLPVATAALTGMSLAHPTSPQDRASAVTAATGPRDFKWVVVDVPAAKPEVRNAAVQALFTSLVTHGGVMSDVQWEHVCKSSLLPLVYQLTTVAQVALADDVKIMPETLGTRRGAAVPTAPEAAVTMVIHHSRDTVGKQWNETRILAYQGMVRMLVTCFSRLQRLGWFPSLWSDILAVLERSIVGSGGGAVEPIDVSVPSVACLLELALLVCVPSAPARPADDADKYTFDMRVVDGALVRVSKDSDQVAEDAPAAPEPGFTVRRADSGSGDVVLVLREQLWQDVMSVLQGVSKHAASVDDDDEAVTVAAVESLLALASACVSPTAAVPTSRDQPRAVAEVPNRFTSLLHLGRDLLDARRKVRWASTVREQAPTLPAELAALVSPGNDAKVLAEDLAAPRLEVASNAERAALRGLEKVAAALWSHSCVRIQEQHEPRKSGVAHPVIHALDAAWTAVLETIQATAVSDDGMFAAVHVRSVGDADATAVKVCVPSGALQTQAMRLLQRLYESSGRPDAVFASAVSTPALTSEQVHSVQMLVLRAMERAFTSGSSGLASALLRTRRVTDFAANELRVHEEARRAPRGKVTAGSSAPANESSGAADRQPARSRIGLDAVCHDLHVTMPQQRGSHTGADEAAAVAPGLGVERLVYPVKVWGFGLGGNYGPRGDGSLVVADAAKAQRCLTRCRSYADALIAALVVVVQRGLRLHHGGERHAALLTSTADVWTSLLATLESLVGFTAPVASPITVPGTLRRAGDTRGVAGSALPPWKLLQAITDAVVTGLRVPAGPAAVPARSNAYLAVNAVLCRLDAPLMSRAGPAQVSCTTPDNDATLSVPLTAVLAPSGGLPAAVLQSVMVSAPFISLLRCLGWGVMDAASSTDEPAAGPASAPPAAGGTDDSDSLNVALDAELFLLRAVVDGVLAQLHAVDVPLPLQSVACRLLALLAAGACCLCYVPFSSSDDAHGSVSLYAPSDSASQPALANSAAVLIASQFRRQRAFGRACLDALVRICDAWPGTQDGSRAAASADAAADSSSVHLLDLPVSHAALILRRCAFRIVLSLARRAVHEIAVADACVRHDNAVRTWRTAAAAPKSQPPQSGTTAMTLQQFAEGRVSTPGSNTSTATTTALAAALDASEILRCMALVIARSSGAKWADDESGSSVSAQAVVDTCCSASLLTHDVVRLRIMELLAQGVSSSEDEP